MIYGYARVSTDDQTCDAQRKILGEHGVDRLFVDEGVSGSYRSRPELDKMLKGLNKGDTVVVWKLDRLGRSLHHLIDLMADFSERGIEFVSIRDGFDTSTAMGIAFFQISCVFAELERNMGIERTQAGLQVARDKKVKFGPKFKLKFEQVEVARKMAADNVPHHEIATVLGVSRPTVSRALKMNFTKGEMLRLNGKVS